MKQKGKRQNQNLKPREYMRVVRQTQPETFARASEGSDAESKCEEVVWSSSLGKPAKVYKWINWSSPCRTRKSRNAPLTTMWQRERKPLRSTLGGEAENGDKTWEMLVVPGVWFQAWNLGTLGQVLSPRWLVCHRSLHQEVLRMAEGLEVVSHQR